MLVVLCIPWVQKAKLNTLCNTPKLLVSTNIYIFISLLILKQCYFPIAVIDLNNCCRIWPLPALKLSSILILQFFSFKTCSSMGKHSSSEWGIHSTEVHWLLRKVLGIFLLSTRFVSPPLFCVFICYAYLFTNIIVHSFAQLRSSHSATEWQSLKKSTLKWLLVQWTHTSRI